MIILIAAEHCMLVAVKGPTLLFQLGPASSLLQNRGGGGGGARGD